MCIQNLEHIGTVLPQSWIDTRSVLFEKEKEVPYISFSELQEICAVQGVTKQTDIYDLSQLFHDLGVFLHFQDDPVLKNIIILQNNWATEAVYKLLDNVGVKKQNGQFDKKDVAKIWADSTYRYKHDEILQLMQRFELCYSIPDSPQGKISRYTIVAQRTTRLHLGQ